MRGGYIFALARFGKREHMEALRTGTVRMAPLQSYRAQEGHVEREDPYEGLFFTADDLTLEFRGVTVTPEVQVAPMRFNFSEGPLVYCLWSIQQHHVQAHLEEGAPLVDPRVAGFGEYAAIIHKAPVFMNALRDAMKKAGCGYNAFPVEYTDLDTHLGPVHPSMKHKKFSHQNEYRISSAVDATEARFFELGDLSHAITVVPTERFIKELEIKLKPKRSPRT